MQNKVQRKLEELHIGSANEKELLIAAVSGGADSVCLLLVLNELKDRMNFELEIIHVEHGIRGEESCRDARFVEDLCCRLSIFCHVEQVDVPAYSRETGMGTEEAARVLRYQAFSRYALERNGKIVLAHHMEDNAETVLFQMLRGSSLNGMCGMSASREDEAGVTYLRPLLEIRRGEIEAYLERAGQKYCTDSTNLETEYHRNYLRKEILPRLAEINSAAVPHISRTAASLGEVRDFLQKEASQKIEGLVKKENNQTELDIEGLRKLHPALQKELIYEVVTGAAGSKKDISSVHVEDVLKLIDAQSGKQAVLPYEVTVRKSFEKLLFVKGALETPARNEIFVNSQMLAEWMKEKRPVSVDLPEKEGTIVFKVFSYEGNPQEIPKKSCTKWLDYDKIKDGFCIRNRKNGDFFINDADGHRKKLKNYFIDEKIPQEKRNTMWLLAQEQTVLWLVGGRISEHVKVTEQTKTVMEIQYIGGK